MRVILAGMAAALIAAMPAQAMAQDEGGGGYSAGDFDDLSPPKPQRDIGEALERSKFNDAVDRMFAAADTDHDGSATLAELRAVIGARKEAAIRDRFASIDTNHDRSVSYAEFSQWQSGLGSLALSDEQAAAAATGVVAEDIRPERTRGRGADLIDDLIAPLNATVLVAANTDHDGGTSLAELLAFEDKRFDSADTNHDGWVLATEMRTPAPRARAGG